MPISREEIIDDFQTHIRKRGGAATGWLVGTAKDPRSPFFRSRIEENLNDEMIYREAFTTTAAEAIRDHFVNDRGLEINETECLPASGKIVFIYRKTTTSVVSHQLSVVSQT